MRKYIGTMLIAATLAVPGVAYAGQGRVFREQRQDYNRWDRGEERFYRAYLAQRRLRYIEFRRLNRWQQERYWEWRRSVRDFSRALVISATIAVQMPCTCSRRCTV